MTEDQKLKLENETIANALKMQGNDYYKKKDFYAALDYYQQALTYLPDELVFHTNKAAVFFEMGQYSECIKVCDHCLLITKDKPNSYDRKKLAKALFRKANALLKLGKLEDCIITYEKALEESDEEYIKTGLFNAKKAKEELLGWSKNNLNSGKVWKPMDE